MNSRPLTFTLLSVCVLIVAAMFTPAVRADTEAPPGFKAIFNGKDLTGWHGMQHMDPRKLAAMSKEERAKLRADSMKDVLEHWSVENGELVNDGHGLYLTTDKDYGDVEFLIDYKTVAGADSGIYLRATPQVQIWDTTKEGGKWNIGADKGSGGLYNNPKGSGNNPLIHADKPFGEWNRFRIIQVGARTTVYLNGCLVVDDTPLAGYFDKPKPLFTHGPIQLQTHGGEIRWRNLYVREIPSDEANEILQGRSTEGFVSIFDGRSLDGWAGPVDNYEVRDGAIGCREHKGGTIYFDKEYSDFVARLEFKLPPGGNNGLAIRYPGKGDTAYTGMCELQVLDNPHESYDGKLDPRQYHGSAYGMVPAHRGYLRPTGEWNFQEVTVKGSTIKVELNGTVILDTDLSQVTEFMGKPPAKDRKSGFFGFAGHSSPVMFRNVRIKELH